MPSLLLILPADNTYRYHGAFRKSYSYAPLTLTTLAALVPPSHKFSIELYDEGVEQRDFKGMHFDIVGITCVTSASLRAYDLCRLWQAKGSHTVLGGAHPTLMPQEAACHADTVITGPAEESWPQFIRDFLAGSPKQLYRAASSSASQTTPPPVPRRDLIKPGRYLKVPTLIARPGCLNHCDYCTIPYIGYAAQAVRDVKDVVAEINSLDSRRILFLDPNMIADRVYAKQLFTALIPLRRQWAGLASIDIVRDPELLALLVNSGCRGLLIGFESLQQANLKKARKFFARVNEYAHAIDTLRREGIMILGCFVLGFDHDTPEHLDALPDLVDELRIDLPRYSILTPFPGTALFAAMEQEQRILTRDWSLYDTEHVVFRPANMTPARLQQALYAAWQRSYQYSTIIKRTLRLEHNHLFGILANIGLRFYSRRLYSLGRNSDGAINSD